MRVDEVRNDNSRRAGYALLTVYEYIDTPSESLVYPADCGFKMGFEVCRCAVENVEAIRFELDALSGVCVRCGDPGSIEDLYEGADGVGLEEVRI